MVESTKENSPKNWNELWEPQNAARWEQRAATRKIRSDTGKKHAHIPPMGWDMWQPSKKR